MWIEILSGTLQSTASTLSLPTRGVWIEIAQELIDLGEALSLPTRGVWIEIRGITSINACIFVTPHTGSVD